MALHVLVVQHEEACPPALLGQWLVDAGLSLDVRRPDLGEALPVDLAGHDVLMVLGGSMDADDESGHPWLAATVDLLRIAVRDDVPALGVCLGHQLLARARGGVVARNPRGRQLGMLQVGWTDAASADRLVGGLVPTDAGSQTRCLQWNQDIVVELPDDAVVLAQTPAGEPQFVRFAPFAWGIQAHPEVDPAIVQSWADSSGPDVATEIAERAVAEVAAATDELEATWRPLATGLAAAARGERSTSPSRG